MRRVIGYAGLLPAALIAVSAVFAGQFGEYEPKGFLSDYSRLTPKGGDSEV